MTDRLRDIRKIGELRGWDRNPRDIDENGLARLCRQIEAHGQLKPVICTLDGEVLGGNMRLKAYQRLGITDVWVSPVDPKSEAEKTMIALADNDRAGFYVEDLLIDLLRDNPDIRLDDYHLDLGVSTSAADMLRMDGPTAITGNQEVSDFGDDDLPVECPKCHFKFNPDAD